MSVQPTRLRRLLAGAGGQAYVKGMMIAHQLVMVPLLITAWGLATYGSWLALTVVAGLVSNANLGAANAVRVEITATAADAPPETVGSLVKTGRAMLAALLGSGALALCAASWSLPVKQWLNLEGVSMLDVRLVIALVTIQVVLENFRAIPTALILRTGRYGAPNVLTGTLKLVELAALAAVVLAGGSLVAAAAVGAVCAFLNLAAHHLCAAKWHAGFDRAGKVDLSLARRQLAPTKCNIVRSVGVNQLLVY